MKVLNALIAGVLILGVGCAPVTSASLRMADGSDARVSVLPTATGVHVVRVTEPASGQIDWTLVEEIEADTPSSRRAAHLLVVTGVLGLVVGGALIANEIESGVFTFAGAGTVAGGVLAGALSIPFFIGSSIAMSDLEYQVESARLQQVQGAQSAAPSPAVTAAPAEALPESTTPVVELESPPPADTTQGDADEAP